MGAPQKHRQYRPERKNTIHRLITAEYIELIAELKSSKDSPVGSLFFNPPSLAASNPYATANTDAFGKGRKTTLYQKKQQKFKNMGGSSLPKEKVRVPRGAIGESYRESSDPQFSTAAQRSWVYGGGNTKPKVTEKPRKREPRTCLPGFGIPDLPKNGYRKNGHSFTDNLPLGMYNE